MPTPSGPAQRATEEIGREVDHRGVEKYRAAASPRLPK